MGRASPWAERPRLLPWQWGCAVRLGFRPLYRNFFNMMLTDTNCCGWIDVDFVFLRPSCSDFLYLCISWTGGKTGVEGKVLPGGCRIRKGRVHCDSRTRQKERAAVLPWSAGPCLLHLWDSFPKPSEFSHCSCRLPHRVLLTDLNSTSPGSWFTMSIFPGLLTSQDQYWSERGKIRCPV